MQLDSKRYNDNSLRSTTFGNSTSSKYVRIGADDDNGCIILYDGYDKKFSIANDGLISRTGSNNNTVFASTRMVEIGDTKLFDGWALFPAIAPLITSEYESKIKGTSEYYVPNCHLKNVKSLSSTAEITYNDKTYTLNMDKAIELGLFVESAAAAATSEEGTETA